MAYSPQTFEPLTFFDATPRFRDGSDTPDNGDKPRRPVRGAEMPSGTIVLRRRPRAPAAISAPKCRAARGRTSPLPVAGDDTAIVAKARGT